MSKKMKIFLAAGVAVLLIILAIAIPVLADTPSPSVTATGQVGFADRVAQILGVPKDNVVNAYKQVVQEFKDKPKEQRTMDAMLTRAAQILNVSKDTLTNALQQAAKETRDANFTARVDKAQANGKITPDEASQVKQWFAARPSVVDRFLNSNFLSNLKARFSFRNGGKSSSVPAPTMTPTMSNFSSTAAGNKTY